MDAPGNLLFLGGAHSPQHLNDDQRIAYRGILESVRAVAETGDHTLSFTSKAAADRLETETDYVIAYIDTLSPEQIATLDGYGLRIPIIGITEEKTGTPPDSCRRYGANLNVIIIDRSKPAWTSTLLGQLDLILTELERKDEDAIT